MASQNLREKDIQEGSLFLTISNTRPNKPILGIFKRFSKPGSSWIDATYAVQLSTHQESGLPYAEKKSNPIQGYGMKVYAGKEEVAKALEEEFEGAFSIFVPRIKNL